MIAGPLSVASERELIVSVTFATGSLMISIFSLFLIMLEILTEDIRISPSEDIQYVSNPDEIWRRSNRILSNLYLTSGREKYACDVTSYPNRLGYEKIVAEIVSRGIIFDRIFCFDPNSKASSDQTLKWYYNRIVDGKDFNRNEIASFEHELVSSCKESIHESPQEELTPKQLATYRKVIKELHEASRKGLLNLKAIPHHSALDFVATEFTASDSNVILTEVMSNFKTDLLRETYVAGINARGPFAREFISMLKNVLMR